MLDLGGIGKGFAEAAVREYLEASDAGYGVLSFGGNISVFGEHPAGEFTIALRDPTGGGHAAEVKLASGSISVSGGYERYYEIGGDRYCHIIDPSSGMPADGNLLSVSVISSNGTAADALSTALSLQKHRKKRRDFILPLWIPYMILKRCLYTKTKFISRQGLRTALHCRVSARSI